MIICLIIIYSIFGGFGSKQNHVLKNEKTLFLFAHRGVVQEVPENTIESVQKAKDLGFKGVEIDINETKDGQLILFHDDGGKRLMGVDSLINDMNFENLMTYPILLNNSPTKYRITSLRKLFSIFGNDLIYYLDVKRSDYELMKKIILLIKEFSLEKNCIIADHNYFIIARLESEFPEIMSCMEGFSYQKEWLYYIMPRNIKPDFYSGDILSVNKEHIQWLGKENIINQQIIYGVDNKNYQIYKSIGVKNMILDFDSVMKYQ